MVTVFRNVLLGLIAIVGVLAIVVVFQSSELRVSRETKIDAPPATVFEQVNDLHKWQEWSPWDKMDPEMKRSFDGPPSGKNASYAWSGNDQVGEGKMTIIESKPNELIRVKLDFVRPWPSANEVEFHFKPEGASTETTWTMTCNKNFMAKAAGLFMNMEKLIGGDFEKGLAEMKKVSEEQAKATVK